MFYLLTDQKETAYSLLTGFSLERQETRINRAKDVKWAHIEGDCGGGGGGKGEGWREVWNLVKVKGTKWERRQFWRTFSYFQ